MTLAVTPNSAANVLRVQAAGNYAHTVGTVIITQCLFQDSNANAIAVSSNNMAAAGSPISIYTTKLIKAGTTSSTTFKIRAGGNAGATTTFNGTGGGQLYNGTFASFIEATEFMA
jgi:hypothetical protein